MSSATDKTVTVSFDPTALQKQTDIIGPATETKAGVATAAQVKKLNNLVAGGTLKSVYNNGASSADQTMDLAAAKGGPVILKSSIPSFGTMLSLLTSAGAVIFDAVDGGFGTRGVAAAEAFIRFDPVFGRPAIGNQTAGGRLSYTADGVGVLWGGSGITADAVGGGLSKVTTTVDDVPVTEANVNGVRIPAGKTLGVDSTGTVQPVDRIAGKLYHTSVGTVLTIVGNAIAPTSGIHLVGDGAISNITKPYPTFRGSITLIPTGPTGFTWNATGNIATSGSTTPNVPVVAVSDGTTWYIS